MCIFKMHEQLLASEMSKRRHLPRLLKCPIFAFCRPACLVYTPTAVQSPVADDILSPKRPPIGKGCTR
jgi:hypothetical protein